MCIFFLPWYIKILRYWLASRGRQSMNTWWLNEWRIANGRSFFFIEKFWHCVCQKYQWKIGPMFLQYKYEHIFHHKMFLLSSIYVIIFSYVLRYHLSYLVYTMTNKMATCFYKHLIFKSYLFCLVSLIYS